MVFMNWELIFLGNEKEQPKRYNTGEKNQNLERLCSTQIYYNLWGCMWG